MLVCSARHTHAGGNVLVALALLGQRLGILRRLGLHLAQLACLLCQLDAAALKALEIALHLLQRLELVACILERTRCLLASRADLLERCRCTLSQAEHNAQAQILLTHRAPLQGALALPVHPDLGGEPQTDANQQHHHGHHTQHQEQEKGFCCHGCAWYILIYSAEELTALWRSTARPRHLSNSGNSMAYIASGGQ